MHRYNETKRAPHLAKRDSLRECYLKSPHPDPPLKGRGCGGGCERYKKYTGALHLVIRYSLRSYYFQTPIPLPPFPHGKGERVAPVSAPMRAQAENAEGGLNENIRKTPVGVLPIFSFAREARRTAPFQRSYVLAQRPPPRRGGKRRNTH